MVRGSIEELQVEREDIYEIAGTFLEKLIEPLRIQAEELRKKGYPIDDQCRIKLAEFREVVFTPGRVDKDFQRTREKEASLPPKESKENIGELLEAAMIIAINQLWFKQRLIAVRTAKFDDFANGVDLLIIDQETKETLAIIDTTTSLKDKFAKLQREGRLEEWMGKIRRGGKVQYGISLNEENKIQKGELSGLPIFIVSLDKIEVLQVASDCLEGKLSYEGNKLSTKVAESLERQCVELLKRLEFQNMKPPLQQKYQKAGKIFQQLNI